MTLMSICAHQLGNTGNVTVVCTRPNGNNPIPNLKIFHLGPESNYFSTDGVSHGNNFSQRGFHFLESLGKSTTSYGIPDFIPRSYPFSNQGGEGLSSLSQSI